jgi:ubiquinone/menaquinone biosynthesis C-methylase UbiE
MYDERYVEEQERKYRAALTDVPAKGLVLDLGCGTGLLFRYAYPGAEEVVGVDLSGQLLLYARERAKAFTNVSLVQADADHLPFVDGKFHTVFAFTILQNLPKPSTTLKEIRRAAQNGSAIVVTGLKKSFSMASLEQMLKGAGLHLVLVKDDEELACYVLEALKER